MRKLNRREIFIGAIVVLLIIAAVLVRMASIRNFMVKETGWLRGVIQCGLAAAWYISIKKRILRGKMQDYLLLIAVLVFFWLAERTIKYMVLPDNSAANRYFWYMFYIPMELIPLLGILTALCMRQPADYKPANKRKLLWIPALVMIVLVMTNDLHQLVFVFPNGVLNGGNDYSYGPLYLSVVLCIGIETVGMLMVLWRRSNMPLKGKRFILPFVPVILAFVYAMAYVCRWPLIRLIAGDMTAVFCLAIASTLEMCILTGMIPSNTRYEELFQASTIAAKITDKEYHVFLSSDRSISIDKDIERSAEKGPVILDDRLRLYNASIAGGHVLWIDDITELMAVLQKLEDNKETLESSNVVLEKNYQTAQNIRRLEEQNLLYDSIAKQTSSQIELSSELLKEYRGTADEEEKTRLLGKLVVIGAYLKRRSNLIFIAEQNKRIPKRELELCIEESIDNLKLYGVQCGMYVQFKGTIPVEKAMQLYDFFEKTVESALDSLRVLVVRIFSKNGCWYACIDAECDRDLSELEDEHIHCIYEGSSAQLTLQVSGKEMSV